MAYPDYGSITCSKLVRSSQGDADGDRDGGPA